VLTVAEIGAAAFLLLTAPAAVHAQETAVMNSGAPSRLAPNDPTIDNTLDAAEADGDAPKQAVPWNEYNGRYFTARLGGGFLYDYANYSQDGDSKSQMDLSPKTDLRDFRLLLKGRFKFMPRVSYTIGYMYEKAKEEWRFRQTGFMVDVPELWGSIFIGRTKEGFSTSKIMVGYQG
jgi:phosphate-selective porin OprO/OprP